MESNLLRTLTKREDIVIAQALHKRDFIVRLKQAGLTDVVSPDALARWWPLVKD